ncbi:MAG: hypothetical protein HYW86_01405 [Candidatus Roizmanbacteria bacterium]|nr:MAG: hypothetical protein HYW86_01405 [Candidatus Roizmanbacteria bacterium]
MTVIYYIFLAFLSIFSYVLIDPNLTLFNHEYWNIFRNFMVSYGYYRRDLTSVIYIFIILVLVGFNYYFIHKYKQFNPFKLAIGIAVILFFSYPFLSHDFFNYIFDAKILTFYHQNPYTHKALDFPDDSWLRFMQWTHRTYPYGPSFLLITLIPSFLSFGKFILNWILFKIMFIVFYLLSAYLLTKMNKKWGMLMVTSPLVIIEGLISLHNDFIALVLAIVAIFYLQKKNKILSGTFFLLSGGIKYITLPFVFLVINNKIIRIVSSVIIIGLLIYLSLFFAIQPWYFFALLVLIPFYENLIIRMQIFFGGLLLSYYPYMRFGEWSRPENVVLKQQIIIVFLIINIIYLLIYFFLRRTKKFFNKNK